MSFHWVFASYLEAKTCFPDANWSSLTKAHTGHICTTVPQGRILFVIKPWLDEWSSFGGHLIASGLRKVSSVLANKLNLLATAVGWFFEEAELEKNLALGFLFLFPVFFQW